MIKEQQVIINVIIIVIVIMLIIKKCNDSYKISSYRISPSPIDFQASPEGN